MKIELEYDCMRKAETQKTHRNLCWAVTETRKRLLSAIELVHTWDSADDALHRVFEYMPEELELGEVLFWVESTPARI